MSAVTGVVSPVEGGVGFAAPWWPPGVPRRQLMAPLMINSAAAAMPPRSLGSRRCIWILTHATPGPALRQSPAHTRWQVQLSSRNLRQSMCNFIHHRVIEREKSKQTLYSKHQNKVDARLSSSHSCVVYKINCKLVILALNLNGNAAELGCDFGYSVILCNSPIR